MIPVSRMRERIQITQQAVRTDAMGNHVNVQVPYCSRWAYVNKMSGSETEEAGTTRSEESIYFIVRFDEMTRLIDSTGFQVVFHGKAFDITRVDNYRYRNESLTLYGREVRA